MQLISSGYSNKNSVIIFRNLSDTSIKSRKYKTEFERALWWIWGIILKVKKAKKRLKKILDAKEFVIEAKKDAELDKKAKIQANKRDVNAKRIARLSKNVQIETNSNTDNDKRES